MAVMDVNYFIRKFSKIPAHIFIVNLQADGAGGFCSVGMCNSKITLDRYIAQNPYAKVGEFDALERLFAKYYIKVTEISSTNSYKIGENTSGILAVTAINNGHAKGYDQSTPKDRILAALNDIKNKNLKFIKQI